MAKNWRLWLWKMKVSFNEDLRSLLMRIYLALGHFTDFTWWWSLEYQDYQTAYTLKAGHFQKFLIFLKKNILHQIVLHGACFLRCCTFCVALSHTVIYTLQLIDVNRFGMQRSTFNLFYEGIEKVHLFKTSNFWPPFHVRFTNTPTLPGPPPPQPPPMPLCHMLTLVWVTPALRKSSGTFMNFQMKNQRVKRENNFFVNPTLKINVFYIVI